MSSGAGELPEPEKGASRGELRLAPRRFVFALLLRGNASMADDKVTSLAGCNQAERARRRCFGMDRPRCARRRSPGEVVFIVGRAKGWAAPQQVPGQNTGVTAVRRDSTVFDPEAQTRRELVEVPPPNSAQTASAYAESAEGGRRPRSNSDSRDGRDLLTK